MTTNYVTIMMNHLENMQFDVSAASETALDANAIDGRMEVDDCNRFLFVKSGEGSLFVRDDQTNLRPGSLCVVMAGVPHRFAVAEKDKLTMLWCNFRTSYEDREIYKILNLPYHLQIAETAQIGCAFEELIGNLGAPRLSSRLRTKSAMLKLISVYLDNLPPNFNEGSATQDLQKIDIVLQYIDDHLADNVTVEELARQVYLHPNYFIVFFKGILGHSPIQYVNIRRMETAKRLLAQPDCNISAVAGRLGMQVYYFSRMFKAHTGLTPSRYRKQAATYGAKNGGATPPGKGNDTDE